MAIVETMSRQPGAGQTRGGRSGGTSRKRHAVVTATPQERARVLRQARRHSIVVRLMRVLLPVATVLSFGLYFLQGRIEVALPEGKFTGEIPTLSGDNLKMDNPRYEGFTADGAKFVVKAKTGFQDFRNPTTIRLVAIEARLSQPGEQWANLVSNEGVYDTKGDLLKLSGDITVTSSTGTTARLKTADVQTKTQVVTSSEPVIVEMSNGTTVESDGMVLNAKTKEITFEGKVRTHLVRRPQSGEKPAEDDRQATDEPKAGGKGAGSGAAEPLASDASSAQTGAAAGLHESAGRDAIPATATGGAPVRGAQP